MDSFYASIKFKNGEEILCLVKEACPEEDYLIINKPLEIEEVDIPGIVQGIRIKHWNKITHEDQFTIFGEDILCMKELNHQVCSFYLGSMARLEQEERIAKVRGNIAKPPIPQKRKGGRLELNNKTGLIGSVDMAREYLENVLRLEFKKEDPDKA